MTRAKTSPLIATRYGFAAPTTSDNPVARSLQLYGEWAESETDLLSGVVTDGHHVVEVGGDHAAHTLWLAQAVGDAGAVHVIEPQRLPFQQLCANVALNQLANVHTHHAWPGASDGTKALSNESTRRMRLDELALPALHLLKVNLPDVLEDLLKGASTTMAEHHPLIYARLGGPANAEREVDAIKALGYRVWSHAPLLFNPENHAGATRNLFPGLLSCNIIAAHAEGGMEFDTLTEL
ncbi:hypothetical protein [Luteibacter aegosomatissinici]|uniref:hypothetical protein n=1 Tax=Luteibacter aegosomatissinici TaxID=2911539 RepID=UPI001FFA4EED|nr:hypothetical protein [Luteibacter aegosomatissinici]UPG96152.1 hypothetical protein L2Y97_08595 [Luteibacter aegosomatissinici]